MESIRKLSTVFIRLIALGTYKILDLEWELIRGGCLFEAECLLNFQLLQQVLFVYFATKQIVIAKRYDVTKQGFCIIPQRKLHLWESLLLVLILFLVLLGERGWSRGGRIFKAGCLLTSSAFIQINTVISIFSDKNLVPE